MNKTPEVKFSLYMGIFWSVLICAASFLMPVSASGALRAVAGGGSSSGGTPVVPSATCANNGGIIYGSAGAFTCNTSLTTDGAGAVNASASITAPVATHKIGRAHV